MSNGIFNFYFLALLLSEILGVPNLHEGVLRPLDAPQRRNFFTQSEYFTISNCLFNFDILALVVCEILGGPKFTLGALCPLVRPLAESFFVPEASTLLCLMAFLISTFQLFYFPRYQGPKFTPGGPTPPTPPSGDIFVPKASTSQYLIVFFNFNILALVVQQFPRFQGVPNLRQGLLCPPVRPLAENFLYPRRVRYYV